MLVPDSELISRVLVYEDQYAFSQLVKKYQSRIRLFLRRLLDGNEELADELAQETFMLVFRKLKSFRGESSFSTWLYTIAKNQFLQHARRQKQLYSFNEDDEADLGGNLQVERVEKKLDLEEAFKHLRPMEKATLTMSYSEDLSHEDISQILEIPLGTVKTSISRGKNKLQKILNEYYYE